MRVIVLVSGTVQGVGYRRWVQRYARDLGLSGSAENLSDGRVEVVAEGSEQSVNELLRLLKKGPPHARVTNLDIRTDQPTGLKDFYIY